MSEREAPTRRRLHASVPYCAVLLIIASVTSLILLFRSYLDTIDILIFYLATVTGIALITERKPSVTGAVAAFLAFNFFFTVPRHTFFVTDTHDVFALVSFLGLSILISQLVVRARARTREELRHGQQMETLYLLSVTLIRANDLDTVLTTTVDRVQDVFDLSACMVLLADGDNFRTGASAGDTLNLGSDALLDVAHWSLKHGETAGVGTQWVGTNPPAGQPASPNLARYEILLIPILTVEQPIGILLAARERGQHPFDEESSRLLSTFANQAALAIERSLLTEERTRAEVLSRTDELKTALLSAVSHDLRTPLASIKASVTTLLQPGINWSEEDRQDLLEAINEETDRLNRLVTNLLDLSRIEAGAFKLSLDWYAPSEIIGEALERTGPLLCDHVIAVELPDQPTLINCDFIMISEVFANLLENAARYSPSASRIQITARQRDDMLEFRVTDEGSGIPLGEEERIFDKFYRVEARHRPVGSGMGLAICRGFVEAHGGMIWAENNQKGGATVAFTLPLSDNYGLAGELLTQELTAS